MRSLFTVGLFVVVGVQAPAGQELPSNVGDMGSAGIGSSKPIPGLMFSLRAWQEGSRARVVVFARLEDRRAPQGKTESPIATFLLTPGQTVEVRDSEAWGAPRLVVAAETR
jgi:hypothetical protein